jgi:hypothetical protein
MYPMLPLSLNWRKAQRTIKYIFKPFYYYTGSRLGQILHSRIRMQCSSLNQHLYRKNIVNSPNWICGLTKSTIHYLFHCLRYTAQRQVYINSINVPINLTTEILLFESPKLAPNQNVLNRYKCEIFQIDGRTKWWNRSAQERKKKQWKRK